MAPYFVMGIATAVWAVLLTAVGLTRPDFPPTGKALRAIIGVTGLLVAGTLIALFSVTHKQHPLREAAAKAQEAQAKAQQPSEQAATPKPSAGAPEPRAVAASEKEFSITLAGSSTIKAGAISFDVSNTGKVEHDLAVEGIGIKQSKTPLIAAGKKATLDVDLKPGKYKLYCTVPGHEQAGMKLDLTVE